MILVGELSLWIALLMAAWATTVSFSGGLQGRRDLVLSGERAIYATFGFTLLASLGLWAALFTHDFSNKFVASFTSANLPRIYTFTAFWGGQAGSLLLWSLVLSLYASVAVFTNRKRNRDMMPWVTGTLGVIALFFLMATAFGSNPFERLDWIPADGRGMNPQLQNPGMAAHPPMLYLGYIAAAVPFAFSIGALITRRLDAEWLAVVRRWALLSWFFLTIGIIIGMWWAYVELGWGGFWAWDPVENASFLPWLTTTAFLHSIMIQEKRGMLRRWNVTLVVLSFLLTIFGTFITRSGVIQSVHAFAQSSVGNWFFGFLVVATALTAWLVTKRLNDLQSTAELESMVSREAAFLYNNLILVGIAFATLWGTLFPILSEWVKGDKIGVGMPFFNSVNGPLGLMLLALTGIGPLIAWRRASVANLRKQFTWPVAIGMAVFVTLFALGMRDIYALVSYLLAGFVVGTIGQEYVKGVRARRRMYGESLFPAAFRLIGRNRRRYGGYIVHLGVVMLFVAFAGLMFKKDISDTVRTGESITATDPYGHEWVFNSQGMSREDRLNRVSSAVTFAVTRDGRNMGLLTSEKRQYMNSMREPTFEPSTEVAIRSTPQQDVYLVFTGAVDQDTAAVFIAFNPLVWMVWLGGYIMVIGGLIVMWPKALRTTHESGYAAEMPSKAERPRLVGTGV